MRFLFAAFAAVVVCGPGLAEDNGATGPNDPIDQALDECLATPEGETTVGMIKCLGTAYELWDKALNAVYGQLVDLLAPDQKQALKTAQRQWISFRDADQAFLASLQDPTSGSLLGVTTNEAMVDLVKARALQLRGYRDLDR